MVSMQSLSIPVGPVLLPTPGRVAVSPSAAMICVSPVVASEVWPAQGPLGKLDALPLPGNVQ